MSVNKYVGDYRLIEDVDERGRIKTSAEYIGPDYYYLLDPRTRNRSARIVAAAVAAQAVLWVTALVPVSTIMRHVYASLPFAFSIVPLAVLAGVVVDLLRREEPLEHRHADRLRNRYPAACAIAGILLAFSLAGGIVSIALAGRAVPGDIAFLACDAMMLALALLVYSKKEDFSLRSSDSPAEKAAGR